MNENTDIANNKIRESFEGVKSSVASHQRHEAFQQFEHLGIPGRKNEEYRFTPIGPELEKILTKGSFPVKQSTISDITSFLIPDIHAHLIVFVNGFYRPDLSPLDFPENQATVMPLSEALRREVPEAITHFSKLVDFTRDPFAAFNTALWQEGIFIRIHDGIQVSKPFLILHLNDSTPQAVICPSRLLLAVGQKSEVSIIEKSGTIGSAVFSSLVSEIIVGKDATLHYHQLQTEESQLMQVSNTAIHQLGDSRVNTYAITLGGKAIRNNLEIVVAGERCESHFYGLYLLKNDTLADNHTVVDHRVPNSFSSELYKGIMDDRSKGVFNGKIFVRPNAQKTNAFQSNRNLLLSDTATIHTKPQLEIWADDVKCSHGCTSGQLDGEALFYLQSRGLSKAAAKALLLEAFASEILQTLKSEALSSHLHHLISERLLKNSLV
jgi:Fe-S cluster assembly protein SufD